LKKENKYNLGPALMSDLQKKTITPKHDGS